MVLVYWKGKSFLLRVKDGGEEKLTRKKIKDWEEEGQLSLSVSSTNPSSGGRILIKLEPPYCLRIGFNKNLESIDKKKMFLIEL